MRVGNLWQFGRARISDAVIRKSAATSFRYPIFESVIRILLQRAGLGSLWDKSGETRETVRDCRHLIHVRIALSNLGKAWKESVLNSRRAPRLVVRTPQCAGRSPNTLRSSAH